MGVLILNSGALLAKAHCEMNILIQQLECLSQARCYSLIALRTLVAAAFQAMQHQSWNYAAVYNPNNAIDAQMLESQIYTLLGPGFPCPGSRSRCGFKKPSSICLNAFAGSWLSSLKSCFTAPVAVATLLEPSAATVSAILWPEVGYRGSIDVSNGEDWRFGDLRALGGRSRSASSSSPERSSPGLRRPWSAPSANRCLLEFRLKGCPVGRVGGLLRFNEPLEYAPFTLFNPNPFRLD